jgi:hypothetical protein
MAITASIFSPFGGSTNASATADIVFTINTANTGGSFYGSNGSAEQILSPYQLFSINANTDIYIRFGSAGMPNANANIDYRIPANVEKTYQMPKNYDRFKVMGISAANTIVSVQRLTAQG